MRAGLLCGERLQAADLSVRGNIREVRGLLAAAPGGAAAACALRDALLPLLLEVRVRGKG